MEKLKSILVDYLRLDARLNISDFSKKRGVCEKKMHYEFGKVKKDIHKFVPILNFELLGFFRLLVLFHNSAQGLAVISNFKPYYVNNSVRLDNGLLAEYVFFSKYDQTIFIKSLKKKKVDFDHFSVDKVLKQEGSILSKN